MQSYIRKQYNIKNQQQHNINNQQQQARQTDTTTVIHEYEKHTEQIVQKNFAHQILSEPVPGGFS